jgi:hypothetical protein
MMGTTPGKSLRSLLVVFCQLVLFHSVIMAQQVSTPSGWKVVVMQGEAARNVVRQLTAKPLAVRIQDVSNRPVAGALVMFTAPEEGPSGDFANDARSISITTGPDGVAEAGVFHPNGTTGPYQIQVRAQAQGQTATAFISQTNVEQKTGHGRMFAVLAIAGGAGAAILAARAKNSGASAPTISFGGATVGAPK